MAGYREALQFQSYLTGIEIHFGIVLPVCNGCSNRTLLELKFNQCTLFNQRINCSNRTLLELK